MENKLDGNAAAGTLQAIFPFEMTLAQVTCTGCRTTNDIGATAAYMHGMGTIVRCPKCDNVLIRIVPAKGHYLLDM
jgi:NAD-dependent SIR2 family protein deacetylase